MKAIKWFINWAIRNKIRLKKTKNLKYWQVLWYLTISPRFNTKWKGIWMWRVKYTNLAVSRHRFYPIAKRLRPFNKDTQQNLTYNQILGVYTHSKKDILIKNEISQLDYWTTWKEALSNREVKALSFCNITLRQTDINIDTCRFRNNNCHKNNNRV